MKMINDSPVTLTPTHYDAVDKLMKENGQTLGFLPGKALHEYLERGTVMGIQDDSGTLLAYLLYADHSTYFRIVHLCVSSTSRGQGLARKLVDRLVSVGDTGHKYIKLSCRRDYEANNMWRKLAFVPEGEKRGRSKEGHLLTLWVRNLAKDEQLSLFQADKSDDRVDAVLDAQIIFYTGEPDSHRARPSKALLADHLVDSVNYYITDELFHEINRSDDDEKRNRSQQLAHQYPRVEHDPEVKDQFVDKLKQILPSESDADMSDINHLAITAASDGIKVFVTEDEGILKRQRDILECTGISVVYPSELIVSLHELSDRQLYVPSRIAGEQGLEWRRMSSDDLQAFQFDRFLGQAGQTEKKGILRQKLNEHCACPQQYRVEQLWLGGEVMALRVVTESSSKINIMLARIARGEDHALFGRYLLADTITRAARHHDECMIQVEDSFVPPPVFPYLSDMGFVRHENAYVRFVFSGTWSRLDVLSRIRKLAPSVQGLYNSKACTDLEEVCSPLSVTDADQRFVLVPIKPGYAISLVDNSGSARDMFGGRVDVLLRWKNVYYRRKTHHRKLKAPARILWYVSGNQREVVAVSRLDDVVCDKPKVLFKRFKRLGVLDWKDIFDMCRMDVSTKLMALLFSHTFPFRKPVSLAMLREILENGRGTLSLQSPLMLTANEFTEIYRRGLR